MKCVAYLLGVGGMGMAPLARYLADQNYEIYGWDDYANSTRKRQLNFVRWQENIPENCSVCIYSSAILSNHPCLEQAKKVCPCFSRGAFLAQHLKEKRICVVCGSHGKSTVTAYLIHFFQRYHISLNYLLGAEFQGDSYPVACGQQKDDVLTLLELDESDGTIDLFCPDISLILNTDWDHPGYYKDANSYKTAFQQLAVRTQQHVLTGDKNLASLLRQRIYVEENVNDLSANCAIAKAAFHLLTGKQVTADDIRTFPGIKRRQEILLKTRNLTVISDYAHHPSELKALLCSFETDEDLSVVFEPHRISRLQCFYKEFVQVLSSVKSLYLCPVYEAFEHKDTACPSLLSDLPNAKPVDETHLQSIKAHKTLLFVGAGYIDQYARRWISFWQASVIEAAQKRGVCLTANVSLKHASLMGIGGTALFTCVPKDIQNLQALLGFCREIGLPTIPVGMGSNLLIPEVYYNGVVIFLKGEFWKRCESINVTTYKVHAGCRLQDFLEQMEEAAVGGFEFLEGIPGTLGGALAMNAGAHGSEIFDRVRSLVWMDKDGNLHTTNREDLQCDYRQCSTLKDGIAVAAVVEGHFSSKSEINKQRTLFRQQREQTQPVGKCLGCFFKNTQWGPTGKILDELSCKGLCVGDVFVSEKHANFIMNKGHGTFNDVITLVNKIRTKVYRERKILLTPEVKLLEENKTWENYYDAI